MPKKLPVNGLRTVLSGRGYILLTNGTISKNTTISIECNKCKNIRKIKGGEVYTVSECLECNPAIEVENEDTVRTARFDSYRRRTTED